MRRLSLFVSRLLHRRSPPFPFQQPCFLAIPPGKLAVSPLFCLVSLPLSPKRPKLISLSFFISTSVSFSLFAVVRLAYAITDDSLQTETRARRLASRKADMAGHSFLAAQSPLLGAMGCSWESRDSPPCFAILQ